MDQFEWVRQQSFPSRVLFLDGATGSGKTMLLKILNNLEDVCVGRFDYQLEHALIAMSLNKMENDAGKEFIQLLLDQSLYDSLIGREQNFRPNDLSSVLKTRRGMTYFLRLFQTDGKHVEKIIESRVWTQLFIVHQLLGLLDPIRQLPNKEILQIICLRHPYYLLEHWLSYIDMHGTSPRDFTVTLGKNGLIPWFAFTHSDQYETGSAKERAIISISEITNQSLNLLHRQPNVCLAINFEKFVMDPFPYLLQISSYVNGKILMSNRYASSKLKIPRKHINDSPSKSIYKRYGVGALNVDRDHRSDYLYRKGIAHSDISSGVEDMLESAVVRYETEFGLWF